MSDKKVTVDALSKSSWANLKQEVDDYIKWLQDRSKRFVSMLADEGVRVADVKFLNAVYAGVNDVKCFVSQKKDSPAEYTATITAAGEAVIFIEFGSGIAFANQYQYEHGFAPGQYGKHQGLNAKGWLYRGPVGTNPPFGTEPSYKKEGFTHTYGNPANASLGETINDLERRIVKIAQEVYQ